MTLDYEKLENDMYKMVRDRESSQAKEAKRIGVAPSIFNSVRSYCDIHISTYFKLVEWLGKDVDYYVMK
ncbi:hypothetical protein [Flagellimonas sp. SN16]|uniref:hypothetical protein n=1 Tax=Flagellimonas sp. SN16 TaxID=3415142 RepID=UPI003C4EB0BB